MPEWFLKCNIFNIITPWGNFEKTCAKSFQNKEKLKIPSFRSPFFFSCMACSKLLWRILFRMPIHSSISASLSAASRNVLLSCIFSSKANRRTLLFWKNVHKSKLYWDLFLHFTFVESFLQSIRTSVQATLPERPPCTSQERWFLWVPWRCFHLYRSWGCRIHHPAELDGSISSWRTGGLK